MEPLRCCTLTGVDEHTDLTQVTRLMNKHPIAEFGVLYSKERAEEEGGRGRYPRLAWIQEFLRETQEANHSRALHLCGSSALAFLRGDDQIRNLAENFDRVQLNVRAKGLHLADDLDVRKVENIIHLFAVGNGRSRVILQHNANNAEFCQAIRQSGFTDFLIDSSGGRGVSPAAWPKLDQQFFAMRCGFAGGLGPDNLRQELGRISQAHTGKSYWIDMEGKLRNADDRFDLRACETILEQTADFLMQSLLESGAELLDQGNPSPTSVEKLSGFWLNWWAGVASGYAMAIPPKNASRPMRLYRSEGSFDGVEPLEYAHALSAVLQDTDVGCYKSRQGNNWIGITAEHQEIAGASREEACLRAVVLQAFGPVLPSNPAEHPEIHNIWVGEEVANERLSAVPVPVRGAAVKYRL